MAAPFDLHVLSTPPAFILSQDQTLLLYLWSGSKLAWLLSIPKIIPPELSSEVNPIGIYLGYCLFGCIVLILFLKNLESFSGLHYCLFVKVHWSISLRELTEVTSCGTNSQRMLRILLCINHIFSTQRIYTSTTNLCRQALFLNFSKLFNMRNLKSGKKKEISIS